MRILICRHATVHNPNKITYRRLPGFNLNREGQKEAESTGRFLSDYNIDFIFSSPMERCIETASIIKKIINNDKAIVIKEYLNEWEVGEHTIDIARRMSYVLRSSKPYRLYITHRDPLRVLLNKISERPLKDIEYWHCPPGSVYEINMTKNKISAKLLFVPKIKSSKTSCKIEEHK